MNVTDDALARWNGARETMLDGMSGFVLRNGGIGGEAETLMASRGVRAGVHGIAIVGVDDVTAGAAGAAVIARLVVGAG